MHSTLLYGFGQGHVMSDNQDLAQLMQSITEKSLRFSSNLHKNQDTLPSLLKQFIDLTGHFQQLVQLSITKPEKIIAMQMNYWQDALSLTQSFVNSWAQGKPMPTNDSRFNNDDWLNNPFFNLLSHQYMLACKHLMNLLETLDSTDQTNLKRLQFFTKQYLDALAPTNFVHTNPQILADTLESNGKNLLQGLHNLLTDLENGTSQMFIQMSDTTQYKVGENLAITPGKVIFRNSMMELIQYTPQTKEVYSIPLLIIPPWINKYYILDLSPKNSLVRWLVSQGITVFMISWVNPDEHYAEKSLFDYVQDGPKTAIAIMQEKLNVPQVNVLGFCIAGTLLAMLLAYNKAQQDNSIRSATFLASLIDFSDPGDISVFIDETQIQQIEREMHNKGFLPGEYMASSFNSLRANDLIWSFYIKNYLRGKNPVPFDILFWNADYTNMPATMHSQYLRWMYLNNSLVEIGGIQLNGIALDVRTIDIPTFFLSTEKDHIAPWKTTYKGFQLMQGPKRFVLGGSGHIAGIINSTNSQKYGYKTNPSSKQTADQWLAQAKEHAGSWWPEWFKWLSEQSGDIVNATKFQKQLYTGLMDAPGSYVLKSFCVQS